VLQERLVLLALVILALQVRRVLPACKARLELLVKLVLQVMERLAQQVKQALLALERLDLQVKQVLLDNKE
jgi:hypothetical protein